jgi:hypothetical protein
MCAFIGTVGFSEIGTYQTACERIQTRRSAHVLTSQCGCGIDKCFPLIAMGPGDSVITKALTEQRRSRHVGVCGPGAENTCFVGKFT